MGAKLLHAMWKARSLCSWIASVDYRAQNRRPRSSTATKIEEQFFERWGPEPRDGWTLTREAEILHQGQDGLHARLCPEACIGTQCATGSDWILDA